MPSPTPRAQGRASALEFQDLMRQRVEDILLVASPYDAFILEEDGQLNERMLGQFIELGLRHTPGLTHVASGAEAVERAWAERRFNLIITSLHLSDMNAVELARRVHEAGLDVPVVALAFDARRLREFLASHDTSQLERVFLWQGDVGILLGIVQYLEDRWNAPHDSGEAGVPLILVVEDSVRYYSSFLPVIYGELVRHAQRLLTEGANLSQRVLRMRARPKVLLASTFEDAWREVCAYKDSLLALISDVEFPVEGTLREDAGATLARRVKALEPDVPIVLQSSKKENEGLARDLGAAFLLKNSPLLLQDLRRYMLENFGFGDFVFRLDDGSEVARAADLKGLLAALESVPAESVVHHAERNHFSKWLRARADFRVAEKLRPRRVTEYHDGEELRADLIRSIHEYRDEQRAGLVEDFDPATFDGSRGFFRLGGGSLGGKARGLAFVRRILAESGLDRRFPGVRVQVPPSVVVATDVFDQFMEENDLRDFVVHCPDDVVLRERIMAARFPAEPTEALRQLVQRVGYPLAVRSSSLLEDSQYQPFSGVYETYMLANRDAEPGVRLDALIRAIKGVYASTFSRHAKDYLAATPYRLEEEKMAVLIQRIVGAPHGSRFYPEVSGVARSYNFYPTPPLRAEDGIVAVALGLGRTVVGGGKCLRFSPRHPRHLLQFSSVKDMLENSQREFWALDLHGGHLGMDPDQEMREERFPLAAAEEDATLRLTGSTFSPENGAVYDGLARPGVRLVTFAPMLKHGFFPLADLTRAVLEEGEQGMAGPVEIEFAVGLEAPLGEPKEFGFLQIRPLMVARDTRELDLGIYPPDRLLCRSEAVLGNGVLDTLRDLVVVDGERFDRARSAQAAREVAQVNAELVARGVPYVLVGVGRWGSNDPWLGVPVKWDEIAGARVIVEAGFRDMAVEPSQGSHFFQNVTSFQVGYFTVNEQLGAAGGMVDWAWLSAQPALREHALVRHIQLAAPLRVLMDGRKRAGVILKPSS
ncbi:MAG TPA: PEP/pyruvate-binding domain-containing protein [Anaeromyxobacter sp.]|nr:PEP/pyruvate-binding domain-containing protein [Anaeromyxobacter sp.]